MENKKRVSDKTQKIMETFIMILIGCVVGVIVLGLGKLAYWIVTL